MRERVMVTPLTSTWVFMIPECALLLALNILIVYGAWSTTRAPYGAGAHMMRRLAMWVLLCIGCLLVWESHHYGHVSLWGGAWVYTPETRMLQTFIVFLGVCVLGLGGTYFRAQRVAAFEWPLLVLCVVWGLMGLMTADSFLSLYMMLEVQSFTLYILAASHRGSVFSVESALKYFVLGALASGFLLMGGAFCYGVTGTLQWSDASALVEASFGTWDVTHQSMLTFGLIFISVGFLFKLSAFPLHIWTPDVYEGSPSWVTATMSVLPKLALGMAALRFYTAFLI